MEKFGETIKRLRQERGMSIVEAALRLNINKGSLSKYENNLVEPSFSMAKRIASLYGVSLDRLAGEE